VFPLTCLSMSLISRTERIVAWRRLGRSGFLRGRRGRCSRSRCCGSLRAERVVATRRGLGVRLLGGRPGWRSRCGRLRSFRAERIVATGGGRGLCIGLLSGRHWSRRHRGSGRLGSLSAERVVAAGSRLGRFRLCGRLFRRSFDGGRRRNGLRRLGFRRLATVARREWIIRRSRKSRCSFMVSW
jgi:hypothetical protein